MGNETLLTIKHIKEINKKKSNVDKNRVIS